MMDRYHLARGDALEREVTILAHKLGFADKDLARPSRPSPAASAGGSSSASSWRARRISSCSTSRPTTSTSTRSRGSRAFSSAFAARCSSSRTTAPSSTTCAPRPSSSARGACASTRSSYSDYAVAREEDLARENAVVERQQALIEKTEDFIRKNIAGQKTKQAQSRRKMLGKLDRIERPEDVWQVAEKHRVPLRAGRALGRHRPRRHGLAAERGGRTLFAGSTSSCDAESASASSGRTGRARRRS
jgi:ATP-binding cassette subfamily F protein 3